MLELKFRAWSGSVMQYGGFSIHATGKVEPHALFHGEVKTVMQYIGLKDKKGKDVYKGDILETNGIDGELHWEVVFSDDCCGFEFVCLNGGFSSVHNDVDEQGEIIGNIYQHKHLLES